MRSPERWRCVVEPGSDTVEAKNSFLVGLRLQATDVGLRWKRNHSGVASLDPCARDRLQSLAVAHRTLDQTSLAQGDGERRPGIDALQRLRRKSLEFDAQGVRSAVLEGQTEATVGVRTRAQRSLEVHVRAVYRRGKYQGVFHRSALGVTHGALEDGRRRRFFRGSLLKSDRSEYYENRKADAQEVFHGSPPLASDNIAQSGPAVEQGFVASPSPARSSRGGGTPTFPEARGGWGPSRAGGRPLLRASRNRSLFRWRGRRRPEVPRAQS